MTSNETNFDTTQNNRRRFSRRDFLAGLLAVAGGGATAMLIGSFEKVGAVAQLDATTLPIPPLLAPQDQNGTKVFNLNLQQGQLHFLPRLTTATLGSTAAILAPPCGPTRAIPSC
jgi:hypothetical protein